MLLSSEGSHPVRRAALRRPRVPHDSPRRRGREPTPHEEGDRPPARTVVVDRAPPEGTSGKRVLLHVVERLLDRRTRRRLRQPAPPERLRRPPPAVAARPEPPCELPGELAVVEVPEASRLLDRSPPPRPPRLRAPPALPRSPRQTGPSRRGSCTRTSAHRRPPRARRRSVALPGDDMQPSCRSRRTAPRLRATSPRGSRDPRRGQSPPRRARGA